MPGGLQELRRGQSLVQVDEDQLNRHERPPAPHRGHRRRPGPVGA
jgi:hypothetical protein